MRTAVGFCTTAQPQRPPPRSAGRGLPTLYLPPSVPTISLPRMVEFSLPRMVELVNSVVSLIGPIWANQGGRDVP